MIREETLETRTIKKKNTMMLQVTFLVEYNETLELWNVSKINFC